MVGLAFLLSDRGQAIVRPRNILKLLIIRYRSDLSDLSDQFYKSKKIGET